MKKLSVILLIAGLLLSASACSGKPNANESVSAQGSDISDVSEEASVKETITELRESRQESVGKTSAVSSALSKENSDPASESKETTESAVISQISETESSAEPESSQEESVSSAEISIQSEIAAESSEPSVPAASPDSSYIETEVSPEAVSQSSSQQDSFIAVSTKIDSVNVKVQPQDGAEGYIIQYSDKADFPESSTLSVRTVSPAASFSDLTQNKTYYVRTASYHTKNGKQIRSAWSEKYDAKLKEIVEIDGVTYIDGMLIANKTYSLPASYGYGLTDETNQAYYNMVAGAAADGITLWMESGFRSYETQYYTYNSFVQDRGVALADLCSARPGHSEHQSGMAIDFNTTSDYFAGTPEANWIEAHCAEYGFILRYPKGKEAITGYKYEPWHVRYVGKEKATEITKSGLTVEEYYGITSVYAD